MVQVYCGIDCIAISFSFKPSLYKLFLNIFSFVLLIDMPYSLDEFAMKCRDCKVPYLVHKPLLNLPKIILECPRCGKGIVLQETSRPIDMETLFKGLNKQLELKRLAKKVNMKSRTFTFDEYNAILRRLGL